MKTKPPPTTISVSPASTVPGATPKPGHYTIQLWERIPNLKGKHRLAKRILSDQ